ncbi:MAG: heterodisulfide reductase-related iron-sulfur binding cluster [Anaerolineales bacterium]|nr:heterodisulfide reductase-related iron-sulfur binding cluster [Anaerolineales bacterium]
MPIRETFWNIPHWAEIAQYLLGFLTILIFGYGVIRRVRRWLKGKPERRIDQIGTRLWSVIVQAVGQVRTLQDIYPGIMHFTIFWGMIALFIGTILATVDWDVTHLFFNVQFLTGWIYVIYELILDIFGVFLLIGVGMAIYRRYIVRPDRLAHMPGNGFKWDDLYVLVMLVLIGITGYLVEGLRIAVAQPDWAPWSPVGSAIASGFISLGDPSNLALHYGLWISHILIAFVALASIPFSKFWHLIAAPMNIFFRSLEPAGKMSSPTSEDEPGAKDWTDFSWKQLLDFDSCTRCGRCQDVCPAYTSGFSLSPRDIMIKLDSHMWHPSNGRRMQGDAIAAEELWACTSCGACVNICPVFNDQLSSIIDMRRYLVLEGDVDPQLQDALANLGRYGNSFGKSDRMRAKWTKSFQTKIKDARREEVEYLWFVGDYASYHASMTDKTALLAQLFQNLDINFGLLYDAEMNSGNDVRRVGEEGLYEMLSEKNLVALSKSNFKTIVTSDPHSYNTLKNEYSENGKDRYDVLHYSQLLDQLISSNRLKITNKIDLTVTYHDPCYLGRYNDEYDAPRRVIEALGCQLVEMPRNRENTFCCGAGGGRIWMEDPPEVSERPAESRVKEAAALPGVSTLVVTCPKDLVMFQDAVKTAGIEDKLVVKDLIELIVEAVEMHDAETE